MYKHFLGLGGSFLVCCSCAGRLVARGFFSSFVFPVVFQFLEAMNLCSPSKKITLSFINGQSYVVLKDF